MDQILKKLTILLLGIFCATALQAQTVSGVVKDASGAPVTGAGVMVEGTTLGVVTGLDGEYSIDVPDASTAVLHFSMIGMKTVVERVGNRAIIDVVMTEDADFLDEVVVIGYAAVKRRDLMGSVTSVDNKTLTAVPTANVSEALTGKMAGVQVTTTEGDPDAEIKIRVRGAGSITQDSAPLYIVDGFPVSSISDIPSSDIQSIDVLKDAFSTAIYGSRGANGVVLVTTKNGSEGKITVNYNAYYGVKKMANKDAIQVMNPFDFVKLQYEEALVNDKMDENYIPLFGSFADIDQYANLQGNDWVQQIFGHTGTTFNHNLSVSGGSDKVKWTAGYSHIGEDAIMLASDYKRDNLNFKSTFKPIKQITIDVNARYSNTVVRGSGANSINDSGSTSGSAGRLKHSVQYSPIPLSNSASESDLEEDYGDNAPPLESVYDNDKYRVRKNWTVNGAVTWHIIPNLNLKVEGGLDDFSQEDDAFYGMTTYYVGNTANIKNQPASAYSNAFRKTYRNTNTLNYNFSDVFTNSKHKLDLLIGQEFILTKSNSLTSTAEGFPTFFTSDMAWKFMSSAEDIRQTNNFYNPDDKLLSFFGRVNYDYAGRYSFSATMRADGSSKFTYGNQWGFFPSAAVAWTISNEEWMKGASDYVNNLKLRYSFGTAGNNNIPSGVQAMFFAGTSATETGWVYGSKTPWAPTTVGGKTVMANPDLTWETTLSHNLGLDFAFFKNRVTGSVEVYHNTTRDLLIQFPTSGSGYEFQYRNMGSILNKGAELTLNLALIEKENVGLSVGGNISLNKNSVTELGGLEKITATSNWASTEITYDYLVEPGQPLGNIWGYKADGRYSTSDFTYNADKEKWELNPGVVDCGTIIGSNYLRPGALKLKDEDGDGKPDAQIIGNTQPVGVGGFNITGFVYGFDFSANFNYVFGNNIYNANKIEFTSSRKYYKRNLLKSMETANRWTNVDWNTGELITDPSALAAANAGTTMWSPLIQSAVVTDWAVEDGSFLRLANATLGYTFPESMSRKIGMQKLRLYVTGTNLFCWTKYSGYDPEVDTRRATPLTPGVDFSAYPKSIGFVGGINITF